LENKSFLTEMYFINCFVLNETTLLYYSAYEGMDGWMHHVLIGKDFNENLNVGRTCKFVCVVNLYLLVNLRTETSENQMC